MTATSRPVALVTGARRGIGRGISYALAQKGFDVVVNDLEQDADFDETLQGIRDAGAQAYAVVADIASLDTQQDLLDQAVQAAGRIDCLVNNAGVSVFSRGDLLDVSVESYDRCVDIMLRGTFFLTQRFARYLLADNNPTEHHRSIVTISSINAVAASISRGEYCIAKTGLAMMTKLFGLRLAEAGIGVYEVRPGVIDTDMTSAPAVRERYNQFIDNGGIPIARWGQPQDIGQTVATMASGGLPYSVGQAVYVDGGINIVQL